VGCVRRIHFSRCVCGAANSTCVHPPIIDIVPLIAILSFSLVYPSLLLLYRPRSSMRRTRSAIPIVHTYTRYSMVCTPFSSEPSPILCRTKDRVLTYRNESELNGVALAFFLSLSSAIPLRGALLPANITLFSRRAIV